MQNNYRITKAAESDFPEIKALLKSVSLPAGDIIFNRQLCWTIRIKRQMVGVIGLEVYAPYGLLRSFATHSSFQGKGVGSALYRYVLKQSALLGVDHLYLLTSTAGVYFEKKGWIHINRETVPRDVRQSEEFRSICPATAACMYYPLKEGKVKTAVTLFQSGFNCAQSVLTAFAPSMGLARQAALKITSGFGAGICYKGEICGAVTGAYMTLGLRFGRWQSDDAVAKEHTYSLMREFDRQFLRRNGSLYCSKLLNGDISTAVGLKIISEERKFMTRCPCFVKDAAEITESLVGREEWNLMNE
jgi:C_GCAxxG_C_C family probable redox protein